MVLSEGKINSKRTKFMLNRLTFNCASVSYQLNLFFKNFHNGIRFIHLLHPLHLPSLGVSSSSSLSGSSSTHSSLWLCRPCPGRLTSAAPILSFFYLRSPPNKSELSPNWTFSLFSPCTNCPHPPLPPPFLSSPSPSPPPSLSLSFSKYLVNKLNSNCWQFNC